MATLKFSAEASLYVSSGRYRTGGHALSLFRRMNSLRLALDESEVPIEVPGETIPIQDCRPGWIKLADGSCIRDPSLPGGGGFPPGTPGEPGGEGPHGPGGETPEPSETPRPEPENVDKVGRAWARQCNAKENPVICCVDKLNSCASQFPEQAERCLEYADVCVDNVRDVAKKWATQCKQEQHPVLCCDGKAKSCTKQFPTKKKLCEDYKYRCYFLIEE